MSIKTGAPETYLVKKDKFNARYNYFSEANKGFKEYYPKGEVIGLELNAEFLAEQNFDKEFFFEAPWGEALIAKEDDFLVTPPDESEIYRIARKEFFETYQLMD